MAKHSRLCVFAQEAVASTLWLSFVICGCCKENAMMQAVVILQIPDLRNLICFHSAYGGENIILSRL